MGLEHLPTPEELLKEMHEDLDDLIANGRITSEFHTYDEVKNNKGTENQK